MIDPLLSTESVVNSIVSENNPSTEPAMTSEATPMEANTSTILNSSETLATPSVTDISSTPIENIPDTPKKWKGLLFWILWVLGISLLGGVSFAGYTYYERVNHPDWTASEIGVFIRDGVIDSLTSHAMVLSGSEPTFTTINTNYTLSGEWKGLEMAGFKNANATLNMSGSAYMEPLVTSGSLPVFDGSFTMTLALEWSGKKWVKWSLAIGVDTKSTGGTILYIKPNNIKLIAPDISEQLGQEIPISQIESSIDELNKTYLGKWYRIDLKQAGEELPKLASEIPGVPYGLPTESIDTEKFIKEQQEAEKQMNEHLGKLKAIFDKHTLIKATARDIGWKSYIHPRSITYDASLDQEGLSALLLDSYEWLKDAPMGDGKTAGVTYNMEDLSKERKEWLQETIKRIIFEFTLSWDMKKHGDMELKKFTVNNSMNDDPQILTLDSFMKTKVDRDGENVKIFKNGILCDVTIMEKGITKSICDTEWYSSKPFANVIYSANTTFAPQNFSISGSIDLLTYNSENRKDHYGFNEKLGLIKFDTHISTLENTVNKFSQKMNFNVDANLEQANTNVKFSLDGSQTTEKVAKRTIDPVSESIDIMETIRNNLPKSENNGIYPAMPESVNTPNRDSSSFSENDTQDENSTVMDGSVIQ